ncbi:MAG: GH92 family glycosyl hydrolase [Tannerellaceae bacterium]|jgi:predicted alpha-1,2-mannosidase|nr:GH92 family glycosyl hydrolase [Tannerellaceae bacterium]
MKLKTFLTGIVLVGLLISCSGGGNIVSSTKEPVDYVNPYMGNISHLLVPTYPTIQLPNSMMRVFPVRSGYTADRLNGLPLIVTNHRRISSFTVTPFLGNKEESVRELNYDREKITPYRYQVYLEDDAIEVDYAPSHRSAIYTFTFEKNGIHNLLFECGRGKLIAENNTISGYQQLNDKTHVYFYAEIDVTPEKDKVSGSSLLITIPENTQCVSIRYGISYISEEQAEKNLKKEISDYNINAVAKAGRNEWNEALNKIKIEGGTEDEKVIFYTSLYRYYERPVNLSEDGYYFSAYDGQIHADEGRTFYTDDWIWDTYRAAHPLRVLINREVENDIIRSYILMAEEKGTNWMPTFPGITGDAHSMNSNHAVASVIDAYNKGLRGFDLEKAYLACKEAIEGKSLIPWVEIPAGELDDFYKKHGFFPALKPGEKETVSTVHSWEKRQPIAVTLGTSYDHWCLSLIARELGKTEDADLFLYRSYNYRNIFNPETGFFHPKDKEGMFVEGVDYRYSGGLGARDYYDENNGYIYRWDVQHNIGDLVSLIGGNEAFVNALDQMFSEPLGKSKWEFYATLPDHTGNVGQFSMANEPCLHIPYLYNYAGQPWKTQKRIRTLLNQWFRNDLMGVPGDEDGGGMSAFVVFSQMGFYPVTPGSPTYNIGSPVFSNIKIDLGNHIYFEIVANNASPENKYIQSATLNGKELNQAWFTHDEIKDGGLLIFEMGPKANKEWGKNLPPPSVN